MGMSLLQQLTEAADSIDPSLLPSSNDVQKLAGAIVHFLEHGEKLLEAAQRGAVDVSDLLTGQPEPDQAAAAEPLPAGAQPTTPTAEVPSPAIPTPAPQGNVPADVASPAAPAAAVGVAAASSPASTPASSPTDPADMSAPELRGEVAAAKAGDATATNPDRPGMTDAELEAEIQSLSAQLATSRQTQADAPAGTSEG